MTAVGVVGTGRVGLGLALVRAGYHVVAEPATAVGLTPVAIPSAPKATCHAAGTVEALATSGPEKALD